MDFPYFGVLWTPTSPEQHSTAVRILNTLSKKDWHPALQSPGLAVYIQQPPAPYLSALRVCENHGIILGQLFDRSGNRPQSTHTLHDDTPLSRPDIGLCRHLTHKYWGGYIAIFSDPPSDRHWVMRDCSGLLSCYYTTTNSVTIVSSSARFFPFSTAEIIESGSTHSSLGINWQYMRGFLAYSQLQIRDTAIKGVYELLAGETFIRRDSRISIDVTWNPANFSAPTAPETLDASCDALRETTHSCVNAWASLHERVIHSLSGGFDSSLLLALLSQSPKRPHVVCINRHASGPAEDERYFARIAANHTTTELIEWPWNINSDAVIDPSVEQPLDAKPSISSLISPLEVKFFSMLRNAHRFDAVWTGEGGDHLFLALPTSLCFTDFARTHGLRAGFGNVLYNTACLTGRSIPNLLFRTILSSASVAHDTVTRRSLPQTLLHASPHELSSLGAYIEHPWVQLSRNVVPGKQQQILLLSEVLNRLRPIAGTQESVELQPLLSQPIIELCLRIPTYQHLYNGRIRGLARRAFAADLPPEILCRELKGQTTHYALGILRHSLPFVSNWLLHGELVNHGLVNPLNIKALLSEPETITASQIFPLFACVAAEVWVRHWTRILLTRHDDEPNAPDSTSLD